MQRQPRSAPQPRPQPSDETSVGELLLPASGCLYPAQENPLSCSLGSFLQGGSTVLVASIQKCFTAHQRPLVGTGDPRQHTGQPPLF